MSDFRSESISGFFLSLPNCLCGLCCELRDNSLSKLLFLRTRPGASRNFPPLAGDLKKISEASSSPFSLILGCTDS